MLSCWPQSHCSCLLPCPSLEHWRVHRGGLNEGCSGSLLSGGDTHSVWLCNLANTVVSRGHSRGCPVYAESKRPLLNTTEVTLQQCRVSSGWQPTNSLTGGVWLEVGMLGRMSHEQYCWSCHRFWDSKIKKPHRNLTIQIWTYLKFPLFWFCWCYLPVLFFVFVIVQVDSSFLVKGLLQILWSCLKRA